MDGVRSSTGTTGDDQHGVAWRDDTGVLLDGLQCCVSGVDCGMFVLDGADSGIRTPF